MVWSVQIPNPLTVGGQGVVGEIDVLNDDGVLGITLKTAGGVAEIDFNTLFGLIARAFVDVNVTPPDFDLSGYDGGSQRNFLRFSPGSIFTSIGATDGTATNDAYFTIQAGANTRTSRAVVATDNNGASIPESWHDVALQNLWTNFGAPYSNVSYRFMPDGTVRLRGTISAGTKADGTLLFTLPAAYRPSTEKLLSVRGNSAGATPSIQLTTGGAANIFFAGAITTLAFDNVSFDLGII